MEKNLPSFEQLLSSIHENKKNTYFGIDEFLSRDFRNEIDPSEFSNNHPLIHSQSCRRGGLSSSYHDHDHNSCKNLNCRLHFPRKSKLSATAISTLNNDHQKFYKCEQPGCSNIFREPNQLARHCHIHRM
eukprot:c12834_g1_i1.p1 GENE.c12834_g1_i1~~c12834_g1_i1.p1  ORF type:complete len:130 (+),score=26.72 c12834_g1_i1:112-501(+)